MEYEALMGNKNPSLRRFKPRLYGIIAIKGITTLISKGGQRLLLLVICGNSTEMRQLIPGQDGGDRDGLVLSTFLDS